MIREFVEDHDSVLISKISEQRFPVPFDLRDAGEVFRGDIDELVELYLRGGLRGLIDAASSRSESECWTSRVFPRRRRPKTTTISASSNS
nr:hypothetical protein [Halorubrum cibi]